MGLFDRIRGIGDPVEGTYTLTSCSANSGGAVYENCSMEGVVSAPGLTPTAVSHSTLAAPTAKWPEPGDVLPVTFDRQHPNRLKIDWAKMPTNRQRAAGMAQRQAQQMAAAMGGPTVAPGAPQTPGAPDPFAALPPQLRDQLQGFLGAAQAQGATVTTNVETSVVGATGRPAPGAPGGGLTPTESQQAMAGGGAALGLQTTTARVLAAHQVDVPAGMPTAPGGVWDLTLDVAPTTGEGYTTVLRINFSSPERRASVAAVGRELPVLADPDRHDRIAVDTSRLT